MAFEIVDGMTGTKHISSDDLSALNVATIGKANCVLKYGDDFKLTMASANSATLGTGVGMVGGKRFWNQAATSLTVTSGTQGQKRNDLVVARYAKTSAGIESITPVVIKGTPATGTAADPATTSNDLKLWRIPLNGISVGTPVRLFDPMASLATLGDSVSPTVVNLKQTTSLTVNAVKSGNVVTFSGYGQLNANAYSVIAIATNMPPASMITRGFVSVQDGSAAGAFLSIAVNDTAVKLETKGLTGQGAWIFFGMTYITND